MDLIMELRLANDTVIDRKGVLRYISSGASEEEIELLGQLVEKLVNEDEPQKSTKGTN